MKHLFLILSLFLIKGFCFAIDTDCTDGKIVFRTREVYNEVGSSGTIVAKTRTVSPSQDELNISTCAIKFFSNSEWLECQSGNKRELIKKAVEVKKKRDEYDDFRNSDEFIDYRSRYNWLKEYINGLP